MKRICRKPGLTTQARTISRRRCCTTDGVRPSWPSAKLRSMQRSRLTPNGWSVVHAVDGRPDEGVESLPDLAVDAARWIRHR